MPMGLCVFACIKGEFTIYDRGGAGCFLVQVALKNDPSNMMFCSFH